MEAVLHRFVYSWALRFQPAIRGSGAQEVLKITRQTESAMTGDQPTDQGDYFLVKSENRLSIRKNLFGTGENVVNIQILAVKPEENIHKQVHETAISLITQSASCPHQVIYVSAKAEFILLVHLVGYIFIGK